jgi:hypothetical protein
LCQHNPLPGAFGGELPQSGKSDLLNFFTHPPREAVTMASLGASLELSQEEGIKQRISRRFP